MLWCRRWWRTAPSNRTKDSGLASKPDPSVAIRNASTFFHNSLEKKRLKTGFACFQLQQWSNWERTWNLCCPRHLTRHRCYLLVMKEITPASPPMIGGLPSTHIFDSSCQRMHLFCWAPAALFRNLMSPQVTELPPFSAVNLCSPSQRRVRQVPCHCMGATIVLITGSLVSFKISHTNTNEFNPSLCCWQLCILWLDTCNLPPSLPTIRPFLPASAQNVVRMWIRSSRKHPGVPDNCTAKKESTKLSGSEQWIF